MIQKIHLLSPRQYLVLVQIAIFGPLGDAFLSRGMVHLPDISLAHPGLLVAAIFTPWVAGGIALLICFFSSYLSALSWSDLTFVLPSTAFGYIFIVLLARVWLHETISRERWAGILLIAIGVWYVAQGEPSTAAKSGRHGDKEAAFPSAPKSNWSHENDI